MSFSKNPTTTAGDFPYCDQTRIGAPGRLARLVPNATATQFVLSQTSSVPSWVDPNTVITSAANMIGNTGATITTGYLGETVLSNLVQGAAVNLTSGAYAEVRNLVLPSDGIWGISFAVYRLRNLATVTATNYSSAVSNTTASVTGSVDGITYVENDGILPLTYTQGGDVMPIAVCKLVSGVLTLPGGSTMNLTANTLYLNAHGGTFTSGPVKGYGTLMATRLA